MLRPHGADPGDPIGPSSVPAARSEHASALKELYAGLKVYYRVAATAGTPSPRMTQAEDAFDAYVRGEASGGTNQSATRPLLHSHVGGRPTVWPPVVPGFSFR